MWWIASLRDKHEGLQFMPGSTTTFSARYFCVHALSTVFLLGGLGVEGKVGLRELSITHRVNYFVRRAKGEVAPSKRRTLGEPQRETEILLPLLLSAFVKECSVCLAGCRSVGKVLRSVLKSDGE